ncbi:hypothetical protein A4R40_12050 [Photorhabdus laumondii subsp. laumondii]|nr:hypothetical protein A4R40_12050 [Photorhabdus laumondii subsp. laumondii]
MNQPKPFALSKLAVWRAYKKVKANKGSAGIDGQSIEEFEKSLVGNLYKLWNRMASGSYMPPVVRRVEIPKTTGGARPLGIPTVADRIAQGESLLARPDNPRISHRDLISPLLSRYIVLTIIIKSYK